MKVITKLIQFIIILAVIALFGRRYLGGFKTLTITEQKMGPYTIAYMSYIGNYSKVGPTMDTVNKALIIDGITSTQGIGIYYDDPATKPADKLTSDVGTVINPEDISKLDKQSEFYKIKDIPGANSVVIEFPIKNAFSYMVGPIKVYPVLSKYITDKGYQMQAVMELYDMTTNKIYYFINIKTK